MIVLFIKCDERIAFGTAYALHCLQRFIPSSGLFHERNPRTFKLNLVVEAVECGACITLIVVTAVKHFIASAVGINVYFIIAALAQLDCIGVSISFRHAACQNDSVAALAVSSVRVVLLVCFGLLYCGCLLTVSCGSLRFLAADDLSGIR